MPYKIIKDGKKYKVVKKSTGKVVAGNKTSMSKEHATKTMRAMHTAEDSPEKMHKNMKSMHDRDMKKMRK